VHFREVVELVCMEELSYRDAAEKLEVPLGTIMSRLHRARRLLSHALADAAPRAEESAAPRAAAAAA
jgi:RNA polymerase sigma-70 factor (ECF subfamily)